MSYPTPTLNAIEALAPSGTLRAAINLSNFLLVSSTVSHGTPVGVSPDMARAVADQLGVGLELLTYKNPGDVADAAARGEWDIGNIGAEPARAEYIDFSPAYAEIESTYLVPAGSSINTFADVDQPGIRISVKERAAYALWLERNLKHAELVQTESLDSSFETFIEQRLDALAGLRPRLMADVAKLSGARVLDGQFSAVQQAMGTPRHRDPAGFQYLTAFVEEAKASGLVGQLITKHGADGLSVAPRLNTG
jgi:polar amino acid transport system substrate-binding protein